MHCLHGDVRFIPDFDTARTSADNGKNERHEQHRPRTMTFLDRAASHPHRVAILADHCNNDACVGHDRRRPLSTTCPMQRDVETASAAPIGITSASARSPRHPHPDPGAVHNPDRRDARALRRQRGLPRSWRRRDRRALRARARTTKARKDWIRVPAMAPGAMPTTRHHHDSGSRRVCDRGGSRVCRGHRRGHARHRRGSTRARRATRWRSLRHLPWSSGFLRGTRPGACLSPSLLRRNRERQSLSRFRYRKNAGRSTFTIPFGLVEACDFDRIPGFD